MEHYRVSLEQDFADDVDLWQALEELCAVLLELSDRLENPLYEEHVLLLSRDREVTSQGKDLQELRGSFAARHLSVGMVTRNFDTLDRLRSANVTMFMWSRRWATISLAADDSAWLDSMRGSLERYLSKYPDIELEPQAFERLSPLDEGDPPPRAPRRQGILRWVRDHVTNLVISILATVAAAMIIYWLGWA